MAKISFTKELGFYETVKTRVDAYFKDNNIPKRDNWQMYLKTIIIFLWLLCSYIFLVFFSVRLIVAIPLIISLALAFAAVGFNVQHDGGHGGYSDNKKVNWWMAFTLDLIGGSKIIWHQKHNILHHTYTNINGMDADIHNGAIFRFAPTQPQKKHHYFQHLYAVILYGLLTLSWALYDDWEQLISKKVGTQKLPTVNKKELFLLLLTKLFFIIYTMIIPSFFYPVWLVIVGNLLFHFIFGMILSIVFQIAHTVDETTFPLPDKATGKIENEWAIHQVETTADFARNNHLLNWYVGGLNFQIEHHLFPRICHIHYPAISSIVQKTCEEFGVKYSSYPSFVSGITAHFNWLKKLGREK